MHGIKSDLDFLYLKEHGGGWHRLGIGVDILDAAAMEKHRIFSPIDKVPLFYRNTAGKEIQLPDHMATIRVVDDVETVLGIVGSDFAHDQVRAIYDSAVKPSMDEFGLTLSTVGMLFGGSRFFFCAKLPQSFSVAQGDTVEWYAVWAASNNGSLARTLIRTAVRTVCNNTLNYGLAQQAEGIRQRHTGEFDCARFNAFMESMMTASQSMQAEATKLKEHKRTSLETTVYMAELMQPELVVEDETEREQNMRKAVSEILSSDKAEKAFVLRVGEGAKTTLKALCSDHLTGQAGGDDGTMWGAYNALSFYTDHKRGRSNAKLIDRSLFGDSAKLKRQAWDLALTYTDQQMAVAA